MNVSGSQNPRTGPFLACVLSLACAICAGAVPAGWVAVPHNLTEASALCAGHGSVWAAGRGEIASLAGGSWNTVGLPVEVSGRFVTDLAIDRLSGDLWVATLGGVHWYSLGRWESYQDLSCGLLDNVVYGIAVEGRYLWAATAGGACRYDIYEDRWDQLQNVNEAGRHAPASAVCANQDGVGFGFWGGGVVYLASGSDSPVVFTDPDRDLLYDLHPEDGLLHDCVTALGVSSERFAAGTRAGLCLLGASGWAAYTGKEGALEDALVRVIDWGAPPLITSRRTVWVLGEEPIPILHLPEAEIVDVARSAQEVFVLTRKELLRAPLDEAMAERAARSPFVRCTVGDTGMLPERELAPEFTLVRTDNRPENLRIALVTPMQRSVIADCGARVRNGFHLALEEARVRSATDFPTIKVIVREEKGPWGVSVASQLAPIVEQGGLSLVVGLVGHSQTALAAQFADAVGVPLLIVGSGDPVATGFGSPWVFQLAPDQHVRSSAALSSLLGEGVNGPLAVVTSADREGAVGEDGARRSCEVLGVSPAAVLRLPPHRSDYAEEVRGLNPTTLASVFCWLEVHECGVLLRHLRAMGFRGRFVAPAYVLTDEFAKHADLWTETCTAIVDVSDMDTPAWRDFRERYRTVYGVEPDLWAAYGYDAGAIVAEVVAEGNPHPAQVRANLETVDHRCLSGGVAFRKGKTVGVNPRLQPVKRKAEEPAEITETGRVRDGL